MIKLGVYMGPTGNLFALCPRQHVLPDEHHIGELALTTCEDVDTECAIPGDPDEFVYLLDGFEYMGEL